MNFFQRLFNVERDRYGSFTYSFIDSEGFDNNSNYLKMSLENPILMTIIALRCKIYSQMKIKHLNANGDVIENSQILNLLKAPNVFQSQEDFFFQQMWFLSSYGTNYTYQLKPTSEVKALYNLIPTNVDFNQSEKLNKFIITDKDYNDYSKKKIKYTLDNTQYNIELKNIIATYDLANGLTENSFNSSPSRVKGIKKTLANIDEAIKAKNVNLQMAQKYLVGNKSTGNEAQIQETDRKDIFQKISKKNLMITNANVEVKHLVSDLKRLFLDEQMSNDALTCLLAYDMSKDVLNYFSNSTSTYENKEKAMVDYLQNSIQVDANNTMNSFNDQFGLNEKGEMLVASYDHHPAMSKVVAEKIGTLKSMQEVIKLSLENGTITPADAIEMTKELKLKLGL